MTLDEVLTNREELVKRLKLQLSSIIIDWGLKIEAIEIKEVRVLSDTLFESMQAPFRNEQLRIAELSRLEARKAIENTSTDTEAAVRIKKAEQELEARAIEIDNQDKQQLLIHEAKLKEEDRTLKQHLQLYENENKGKVEAKKHLKKNRLLSKWN